MPSCTTVIGFTWTYYKGSILEGKKTNLFASPLPTHQFQWLKMCTKLFTQKDRLSPNPITSPPRKKSKTFGSLVVDSKEDEEWTCSYENVGGGGEELNAKTMHGNIKEEPKPNMD